MFLPGSKQQQDISDRQTGMETDNVSYENRTATADNASYENCTATEEVALSIMDYDEYRLVELDTCSESSEEKMEVISQQQSKLVECCVKRCMAQFSMIELENIKLIFQQKSQTEQRQFIMDQLTVAPVLSSSSALSQVKQLHLMGMLAPLTPGSKAYTMHCRVVLGSFRAEGSHQDASQQNTPLWLLGSRIMLTGWGRRCHILIRSIFLTF